MRIPLLAACAVAALSSSALQAQALDARVGKLESEMRAVQRKVFPGGAGRLIEPEIQRPIDTIEPLGTPATSAVADLTARVASLEQQLQSMTGQVEQNQYRVRQVEEAFNAYKRANDARLKALEDRGAVAPAAGTAAEQTGFVEPARPAPRYTPPAARPAGATTVATTTTAAVVRPETGDAGEDAYMYGYRLWEAKRYGEAEKALKDVVAKYPKHRRASYAQNLLGRSYLDGGKPSLASVAFYENYKKMPDGERAPQSLYYLAQALQTLKKPADACKVYEELSDVYAAKIDARMKADIAKGRAAASCQ